MHDLFENALFFLQAMKRKADMRVWVLFTLIVLTFTLWFLDWYNP